MLIISSHIKRCPHKKLFVKQFYSKMKIGRSIRKQGPATSKGVLITRPLHRGKTSQDKELTSAWFHRNPKSVLSAAPKWHKTSRDFKYLSTINFQQGCYHWKRATVHWSSSPGLSIAKDQDSLQFPSRSLTKDNHKVGEEIGMWICWGFQPINCYNIAL